MRNLLGLVAIVLLLPISAVAERPVKVGELNSYKLLPQYLEPYRKGWQLALEEINASGGVNGTRLEVISRDDNGTPGDAVRVAEELLSREKVDLLMGTFPSHVGLAVANLAEQRKVLFMATVPLTDRLVWEKGNRYTFRLRASTYTQTAMLMPAATKVRKRRWAIVYPNYEYGQSAAASFKKLIKRLQPDVVIVTEQAVPLGKIEAGAVVTALSEAKPDAVFSALFAADLQKFIREGNIRGLFEKVAVFNILAGEPDYSDTFKDDTPDGWWVTGYPWSEISTPEHQSFRSAYEKRWNDYPRAGSVVGYSAMYAVADAIRKARSTKTDDLIRALEGMRMTTPYGPIIWRALDHQSTMGAYVGQLAKHNGNAVMVNWHYADGADYLPTDDEVRVMRTRRR
jgi:branched-chain amino acid transport system substrate-binding protein